jgi:hypothetical protein
VEAFGAITRQAHASEAQVIYALASSILCIIIAWLGSGGWK